MTPTPEEFREAAGTCKNVAANYENEAIKILGDKVRGNATVANELRLAAALCEAAARGPWALVCDKCGRYGKPAHQCRECGYIHGSRDTCVSSCGGTLTPLYALEVKDGG